MHRTRFVVGMTAIFLATGVVVTAQHASAPKPPRATSGTPKAPASPHPAPKAVKPAAAAQTKNAAQPKATKPVSTAKTATPAKGPATKLAKADKPAPPTPATTPAAAPLTPVQQKLKENTNLAAKLTSRLPAGTDLMAASAGFRNLGQFVAAVNVSNNLGISFAQLKTKTVTDRMSLGQAIQALRPVSSATIEAQRAEYDARSMIVESEQQPQVAAATSTAAAASSSKNKPKAKKQAQ
jgi:hypothetical protein